MRSKNNLYSLSMLVPLLLTLLPYKPFGGFESVDYIITIVILIFFAQRWLLNYKFRRRELLYFGILIMYEIVILLSFHSRYASIENLTQIFKPIYFAVIFIFGIFVSNVRNKQNIIEGLLKSAYIIIIAQLVTGGLQLFDISILDNIYSAEKASPISGIIRVVGTMGNPSSLAWFSIQAGVILFLYESNKFHKYLGLIVVLILTILSGSRSMLIMYPATLLLTSFFHRKKDTKFYLVNIPTYIASIIVTYFLLINFLNRFGDIFPYLNQLLPVLKGESLSSVNAFSNRIDTWAQSKLLFDNNNDIMTKLFGLGAGTLANADNAYLYALYNTGFVGLFITLLLFIFPSFLFWKLDDNKFKSLGLQYIIGSLILGYQADTFAGWIYPSLLMYYIGLTTLFHEKEITNSGKINLERETV